MRLLAVSAVLLLFVSAACLAAYVVSRGKQYAYVQNLSSIPEWSVGVYTERLRVAHASPGNTGLTMTPGIFMQYGGPGGTYAGGLIMHECWRIRTRAGPVLLDEAWLSLGSMSAALAACGVACLVVRWILSRRLQGHGFPIVLRHPKG